MLEKMKVRTGMMLVLFFFVITLALACGLSWRNAENSVREIEDLNNVAVHQVDPLYEASGALLRARLALGAGIADLQAGAADQAATAESAAASQLQQARERFSRYMAVPKSERGQELAQILQGQFNAYVAVLDELDAALKERSAARYQQSEPRVRQADAAFAKDMQVFLTRVQERSDDVLARSQTTYSTARMSAIVLLSVALLLAALCWAFIRRGVLLPLQDAGRHFDRIAAGDLTQRVEARSNNEIGMLFSAVRRMQEGLTRTVTAVRQGVEEINIGAAEIAAGNANLSTRTEEQAAALEETASTMEELATTVKQNAENAAQANQLAAVSMEVAQRGGHTVGQVVATMQGISDSSRRIADIVSVIDGIAFQTNILALNAAVEAARAGEQGKGFAVVAGEVRTLAQRAAQAAKEIKALIETSVETVAAGSAQVSAAGQTMEEIVTSVQRVADIMGEISAASTQQAGGIDQVSLAVSQMDEVTQQNAALVEQASAAASAMEEQARRLAEATAVFKTQSGQVIEAAPVQMTGRAPASRLSRP
ncbi:methyl-accepting chemotaxis protein [Achromobacter xylosoxidans]|uniref:methyl-accepting chemotaxis protein n=1 Tax=Alcaligenes xylosoxydans xylosoxydans TaxID=85698 RepID=UPI0006BFDE45|nr:methyl-accepting chemotaxis protein [Achromobacter xylosoxidans]OFQ43472.1 chemotaxis protein [Achromobacter xylosoxidans]OMG81491.1 chemotaxis protein [Achromobacter xylosoxidans]QQE60102.1 Tar ligand binding domain-containing protein [Achromobacter xylosoxidans]QQV13847.1 Tar ligand binding domain-containing protein [Achromobacter xylosoxidans]UXL03874.1 methyl-accepting chemotaxis protein [Achromobacter xylosoxidans]